LRDPAARPAGLRRYAVLLLACAVLLGAAWNRGAEYDEQYTQFLAAAWRSTVGSGLWRLRLLSVLCTLGALWAVGRIARRTGVPSALAMLLTLGCYAFAYTGSVARGFALAQLLALLGVLAAQRAAHGPPDGRTSRWYLPLARGQTKNRAPSYAGSAAIAAGLLLGAASFANYLAAFTVIPVLLWLATLRLRNGLLAGLGFAAFALGDLYFFAAQHGSRPDQFPPFHVAAGLARLAAYGAASVAGGLPLYVPAPLASATGALAGAAVAATVLLVAARWRHIGTRTGRRLLLGAAAATPAGLLLLGIVFNNTPIELRYLSFATPYAALLLAGALASLRPAVAQACTAAVLATQAAALAGLLLRPETMQPMRAAALEAARLALDGTVVLLPRGNDGVGIVGAFVTEADDALRLRLIDRHTGAQMLHGGSGRIALAELDRDAESRESLALLRASLSADPCWRAEPSGPMLTVFEERCGDGRWASSMASR